MNYSWRFECEPYRNENKNLITHFQTKTFFNKYSEELINYSYNKRIPDEYKYGSIEQRLSLLQGLFDTDGGITIAGGRFRVVFTSTSYQLILDIKEILGTLGYFCSIREDKRSEKYTHSCYEMHINISNDEKHKLFRLKRKKDIALRAINKKQNRLYDRTLIKDIKDLGYEEEMTCFLVDNDEHLFLTEEFVVTHNTRALTERIAYLIEEKGVRPQDIVAFTFTNLASEEMKKRLGSKADGAFIGTIHSYANSICQMNNIDTFDYIYNSEFDKIIEKALVLTSGKYPKVKHLLVDECQDLSPLEYAFIERIPKENVFFVGDELQCQPAGTKVKLRNGITKNIEDVQVGDSVVWYDNTKSYVSGIKVSYNSIEKRVLKTASRDFVNDDLITITTENGQKTKYTPNHIGYIKLHESEYNHAVYLMCDSNNRFRIGKIPFISQSRNANPWRDKMYQEGCIKIWILKIFKTDKEARLLENKLSYKYRIPQTCWQTDKVSWTKEDIDYIYEGLDTYTSALECLKEFHRNYLYPLLDKNTEKSSRIHYAKNAVSEIYAANIMPEVMDVLVYDADLKHKKKYEQIINVEYEYIKEPIKVYSLKVEGGTYVADEIITHNCIYQFRGSTDKYLASMYNDKEFEKFYLVENYRNPPNIIKFAESLVVSTNKFRPNSIPIKTRNGLVYEGTFDEALDDLLTMKNWGEWAILARTNNEVEEIQKILDENEVPNVTFKKGDLDLLELDELIASDRVKVMTIHTAKGTELPNVIVVGARRYNEEERKIAYVAATRAEQALYWCPSFCKRGHKVRKGIKGAMYDKSNNEVITF